jgi:AcrR family transcriptional regulator
MTNATSLRDTLISSGLALLEEGGIQGLTLRKAAARAGVSHAAPAHHFAGLPGLLTAMAGQAFALFHQAMAAQIAAAPDTPRARLQATCQGYLDFASQHAGLFHLMFVSEEVDRADPAVEPHSRRAYDLLREACLPFSRDGAPDGDLEVAVWSMVHGYATLRFRPGQQRRPDLNPVPDFGTCLALLVAGQASKALAPPDQMH